MLYENYQHEKNEILKVQTVANIYVYSLQYIFN